MTELSIRLKKDDGTEQVKVFQLEGLGDVVHASAFLHSTADKLMSFVLDPGPDEAR